jgi:hypothetical protein
MVADEQLANVTTNTLPSVPACLSDVQLRYAAVCDLKSCYQGFLLPERVRVFGFRHQLGRLFRLRSVPTGATWCPLFAQCWTDAVVQFLVVLKTYTVGRAYIDNIRFASDCRQHVIDAMTLFCSLCGLFRTDINEPLPSVIAHLQWGSRWSHKPHTFFSEHHMITNSTPFA